MVAPFVGQVCNLTRIGQVANLTYVRRVMSRAAASSTSHVSVPGDGRTPAAGRSLTGVAPSSTSRSTSAFFAPPTRNNTRRAALIVGKVNVTRSTGGGSDPGGHHVTQAPDSFSAIFPGNSEAV